MIFTRVTFRVNHSRGFFQHKRDHTSQAMGATVQIRDRFVLSDRGMTDASRKLVQSV